MTFTPEAIGTIIREYTREAGIRSLERRIATVCRKIARGSLGDGATSAVTVTPALVEGWLGQRLYRREAMEGEDRVGVATGLVRTEGGGEIIFVEAARMPGTKELIITGSLGEVMRESVQAALSYLRSNAAAFGIAPDFFERHDLHVHVPRGAVPKDGPSAGITIAVALASLLTGTPGAARHGHDRRDHADREHPAGRRRPREGACGTRAKVATIIMPLKNRVDVEELSEEITRDITIKLVDTVAEAAEAVLR